MNNNQHKVSCDTMVIISGNERGAYSFDEVLGIGGEVGRDL